MHTHSRLLTFVVLSFTNEFYLELNKIDLMTSKRKAPFDPTAPPDRWLNCPRKSNGFIAGKLKMLIIATTEYFLFKFRLRTIHCV